VLLIVASAVDGEARRLALEWASADAAVLTPADLCQPGWCWTPGAISDGTFALGGRHFAVDCVSAVLSRLDAVPMDELTRVHPDDRMYVAAEMHAFLVAWLSDLPCVVVNRPTPRCLSGPYWPPETWLSVAARSGLSVRAMRRRVHPDSPAGLEAGSPAQQVVVVGDSAFGGPDDALRVQAVRLARAACVRLLAVAFDEDGRFVSADPRPRLDTPEVVDALRGELLESRT
jgi:hypothetical protein